MSLSWLNSLSDFSKAVIAGLGLLTLGMTGGAWLGNTKSDKVRADATIELQTVLVEHIRVEAQALANVRFRTSLMEETLCLPDAIEAAGTDRRTFCDFLKYTRRLPPASVDSLANSVQ